MKVQDRTPHRLGPYRVIRRLGEGGMGVVYLASDASRQPVAVKALHPGMAQEENARRRLAREVDTMYRVRSPYVAQVLGADLEADPPYIVTRYVPGLTLDDVVTGSGPIGGQALGRLAYGLAEALAAVHAAGVVHRDLKPGNVMIADGAPVVIDFGIAQLLDTTRLTMTGMFMGTPGYLAPEVIEGKDSGPASDVHSWGATVAFAATGHAPYGTGAFEAIFYRIMHGEPDLDMLPAPLFGIVQRALSRDPAARPQAAELARAVAAIDPAMLVPSPSRRLNGYQLGNGLPPGHGHSPGSGVAGGFALPGPGGTAGAPPASVAMQRTMTDNAPARPWPRSAEPVSAEPASLRELLPPVSGAAQQPGRTGQRGTGGEPAQRDRRTVRPVSPWSPLVLAVVVMCGAAAVMAPVAGTAIALALLLIIRAAAITGRHLARRQTADGRSAGLPVVAVALYPVSLLRAAISIVLFSPVALLGFCVAMAATLITVPGHPLSQAVAVGAGAFIVVVGLGPGSGGSRATLARAFSAVTSTPSRRAIAYFGVLALAVWAATTAWYQAPAPAYWPVNGVHSQLAHLPAVRGLVGNVHPSLRSLVHMLGL